MAIFAAISNTVLSDILYKLPSCPVAIWAPKLVASESRFGYPAIATYDTHFFMCFAYSASEIPSAAAAAFWSVVSVP
jgi:hypothetical protein